MNPIQYKSKIAKLAIEDAKNRATDYSSSYSDDAYYAFLCGVLMGMLEGVVLDLDDEGIEKLKRLYNINFEHGKKDEYQPNSG